MLLEIFGVLLMGSTLSYTLLDNTPLNDAAKIKRIADNCGLTIKEQGRTKGIQILRRKSYSWGAEYVYRIPLGLSFENFLARQKHFEDGLNHKRSILEITKHDIKQLKLNRKILQQIKRLLSGDKQRKEVMMDYDGTLRIRVYRESLPDRVPFTPELWDGCGAWMVCIGVSREGMIYHNFDHIPHMVVAGTTRYGKSVFLKNTVTTLVQLNPYAKLTLLDLKGGLAFGRYRDVRQVHTVATNVTEALQALRAIQEEMQQRQAEYLEKGYEDIKESGAKERHFIIIDEAAELASEGTPVKEVRKMKEECELIVSEIARIGGGLGYRLILATQYPTADTLPRQVKQNCDARLCFRLQNETASRVVLDDAGAEQLPHGLKGRAIYQTDRRLVLQTPLIENDFIDRTIKPHIVIKPRKEETRVETKHRQPDAPGGGHTLIISDA